tara:strand:+ start:1516 stop:2577 length:1062 start_codon:yes stop_codon:yes gene_type:complete
MKSLVKTSKNVGFELIDRKSPVPKKDEVLLKVKVATICGSDLHLWEWNSWANNFVSKIPLGVGHETCGEIVDHGPEANLENFNLKIGDIVSVETHLFCGQCKSCKNNKKHLCSLGRILGFHKDGSFSEWVTVPVQNCWKAREGTHPITVSLKEPLGNAVQTVMAQPIKGKDVLITGAGPLGLMTIAAARAFDARSIFVSELQKERRDKAVELGADYVIDPRKEDLHSIIEEKTKGEMFDVLLEISGSNEALNQGLKSIAHGGDVALLGLFAGHIKIPVNENIVFKGLSMKGITGRLIWETWEQVDELIYKKGFDPKNLITHSFTIKEHEEAFKLMEKGVSGKIALFPNEILDD